MGAVATRSRQSAKLFLQSSELGLPHPLSRRRECPPPFGPGGRAQSLAGEGLGESQFRRGDIHCGALYISTLRVATFDILTKSRVHVKRGGGTSLVFV
jgi:hypothetical protein